MPLNFFGHRQSGEESDIYNRVKAAAKEDAASFHLLFSSSDEAKRGFWDYILDIDDFKKWKPESKKLLFREGWFDGFMTLNENHKAIGLVFAATSLSLFALSIFIGTSSSLYTCIMLTSLVCTLSFLANVFLDEEPAPPTEDDTGATLGTVVKVVM